MKYFARIHVDQPTLTWLLMIQWGQHVSIVNTLCSSWLIVYPSHSQEFHVAQDTTCITCSICGQFSSNLNSKQVLHKSVIWKHKIHTPSSWGIFLFFDLNASQFKKRLPLWLLVLCMVSHKWSYLWNDIPCAVIRSIVTCTILQNMWFSPREWKA